jgi:hypothetical protein
VVHGFELRAFTLIHSASPFFCNGFFVNYLPGLAWNRNPPEDYRCESHWRPANCQLFMWKLTPCFNFHFYFLFFLFFGGARIKLRALHMLGKCCTTELHRFHFFHPLLLYSLPSPLFLLNFETEVGL